MNKSAYQQLRFSVLSEITDAIDSSRLSSLDADVLTNNVMRLLLAACATAQVKEQRARREFLTFRRNPEATVPGWAFRKPGIDSRLPTL